MSEFNRMTIVAAAELIEKMHTQAQFTSLATEWGVVDRCGGGSVLSKINSIAEIAVGEHQEVYTLRGLVPLDRALVEKAIEAPERLKSGDSWKKLIAGLRFDGFEIVETQIEVEADRPWGNPKVETTVQLVRMLPTDIPDLDFREAESEVELLLDRHGFSVAKEHLRQAVSAFSRGQWSSSNGALRNFYESYLNEIAIKLGYDGADDSKAMRDFLGRIAPPFLLSDYNEWNANNQKPQYVQGLLSRMHPHGPHPGLSEEEDATFRLQISLVTARLFLRRFDKRLSDG
jgi:hypothetical protein